MYQKMWVECAQCSGRSHLETSGTPISAVCAVPDALCTEKELGSLTCAWCLRSRCARRGSSLSTTSLFKLHGGDAPPGRAARRHVVITGTASAASSARAPARRAGNAASPAKPATMPRRDARLH
ncbi:unnamed protein product [Prorocentrum cordatum]|uniref:Uncharacterized protein n=1 Tax=Prorocentrum cordatum TaxID=2364126 RepID=A0ABN9TCK0_9DINO|nr:unnamed protein product [Polarella glacialis]